MKQKTKEVYYCDYCNKHMLNKGAMNKHELMCYANPENKRPCYECKFLEKTEATVTYEYYGQENCKSVNVFHCKEKNIYLHTPQNAIKKNQFELDDLNEPMPKYCDTYVNSMEDYLSNF